MKYGPTRAAASVSIFHLPRFYTYYETLLKNGISRTIKSILDSPNQLIEIAEVRAKVGKHQVRNFLSKECSEIFEPVVSLPSIVLSVKFNFVDGSFPSMPS